MAGTSSSFPAALAASIASATGGPTLGFVIRDARLGALDRHYVYADYCSGRVWMLPANAPGRGAVHTDITQRLGGPLEGIVSFGVDGARRPLVVMQDGRLLRLVRP